MFRFLNKLTEGNKHPSGSVCVHSGGGRQQISSVGRTLSSCVSNWTRSIRTGQTVTSGRWLWRHESLRRKATTGQSNPRGEWRETAQSFQVREAWNIVGLISVHTNSVTSGRQKIAAILPEICESCSKWRLDSLESKNTWVSSTMYFYPLLWQKERKNHENLITEHLRNEQMNLSPRTCLTPINDQLKVRWT